MLNATSQKKNRFAKYVISGGNALRKRSKVIWMTGSIRQILGEYDHSESN